MNKKELIKKLLEEYTYLDSEDNLVYDWCGNCNKPIQQIEIEGEYGCEYCNSSANINCNIEVEK